MTKRIARILILAIVLMFLFCGVASAEAKDVFEFCDMFYGKLVEMKELGGIDAMPDTTVYGYTFEQGDTFHVSLMAGSAILDHDLTIQELTMTCKTTNGDAEELVYEQLRVAAAIFALEFSATEEKVYNMGASYGIDLGDSPFQKAFNYSRQIYDYLSDNNNLIPFFVSIKEYSENYSRSDEITVLTTENHTYSLYYSSHIQEDTIDSSFEIVARANG